MSLKCKCPNCGATIELTVKSYTTPPQPQQQQNQHQQPRETGWKPIFPDSLSVWLKVLEQPDKFVVKLTKFVDRETFGQIADLVKEYGGEYVSAGKDSRFEIPKK